MFHPRICILFSDSITYLNMTHVQHLACRYNQGSSVFSFISEGWKRAFENVKSFSNYLLSCHFNLEISVIKTLSVNLSARLQAREILPLLFLIDSIDCWFSNY